VVGKKEMEQQGKQGVIVSKLLPNQDPVKFVQFKYKELEDGFKSWLSKQSLLVEAAVVTATSGVQGAAIGAIMGTITPDISSSMPTPPQAALNPQAMASLKQAQVPCLSHIPHSMLLALLIYFSVYFIYIFLQKGLSSFLT
jgi:hypothetical protein